MINYFNIDLPYRANEVVREKITEGYDKLYLSLYGDNPSNKNIGNTPSISPAAWIELASAT